MSLDAIPSPVLTYLASTPSPLIQEIVKVEWQRGTNVKYYSSTAVHALTGFTGLTGLGVSSVEPRLPAGEFLDIPLSAGLEDDSAQLDFWDGDGVISDLFAASGEGTKVTAYYYLPAVDYLQEYFWGYLRTPKESSRLRFKTEATEGLRSPDIQIPSRIFQGSCQALFGGEVDPVTGTPFLTTLQQRADNDCGYNVDLGGSIGVPGFTHCPKRSRADCSARMGDDRSYLAFDVIIEQTRFGKNNRFIAYTQANESASKSPLRVVYGYRFIENATLLGHYVQASAGGFLVTLSAIAEGEINGQWGHTLNGLTPNPNNILTRNGTLRQYPTGFSPNALNYSGTALARIDYKVGTTQYSADQIQVSCFVEGRKVRVYTNPSTYSRIYTRSRPWCLLDVLAEKRFGLGYDYARFVPQDFIDLDSWSSENVTSVDETGATVSSSTSVPTDAQSGSRLYASYQPYPNGDPPEEPDPIPTPTYTDATRTRFDAILDGRDGRQTIRDICMAGRYSVPFHYAGKMRIVPLKKELDLTATAIPVFTDEGTTGRNIVFERQGDTEVSSLVWSQKKDSELVNQVKVTFDNEKYQWAEQSIVLKDELAQLAAGRALGDSSKRVIEKAYALLGTTRYHEAIRSAKILLDLGEFDSGGLENNLEVKFKTWFPLAQSLRLHKYRVIRVLNSFVNDTSKFAERTAGTSFSYFRVMKIRRREKLLCEITAQAYPTSYYNTIEAGFVVDGSVTAPDGPIRIPGRPVRPISTRVTLVTRESDHIVVRVGA